MARTPAKPAGAVPLGGNVRGYLALGLAAGVFSGLLGIGGAAILVPGMVGLMGLTQHQATGTSLMVIIPTAALSAVIYAVSGQMPWDLVLIYSVASILGAVLGARLSALLSPVALRRAFGVFLLLLAVRMISSGLAGSTHPAQEISAPLLPNAPLAAQLALGLAAGILSGLLGIGGGQVLIPGMTVLFGEAQRVAQGVSLAFIVPTSMAGAYTHYRMGTGLPRAAMLLVPGAAVGGIIGSTIAQYLPGFALQLSFGAFLIYVGLRMVWPNVYKTAWGKLTGGGR
ncbi:MAG: sulfite exporter TauE/SafE family protein [Chloroflexi bacterium]|nr:sulfite exporter TauE/SafE family protein [Chloroflexota bacterium]